MKMERLDTDKFNTINYSIQNRENFPIMGKERNFGGYYFAENCPNKNILNQRLIISKELDSQNENFYDTYTNPNNFTQKNPNYNDYNSFCPPKHNMILYKKRNSPCNKYLYPDGNNSIYNYIPNNATKFDTDKFYMTIDNINIKDDIDAIQKENYRKTNMQKVKVDKSLNGVNLNISNLETQYPLTFLNANSFNKGKNFMRSNIIKNMNNSDDSTSPVFKNNKNKKNMKFSKIKPIINITEKLKNILSKKNNNNKEQDSNDSHIYHKKNKSHLQSSNNELKGKYNEMLNNNRNDGINFFNPYKHKKKVR